LRLQNLQRLKARRRKSGFAMLGEMKMLKRTIALLLTAVLLSCRFSGNPETEGRRETTNTSDTIVIPNITVDACDSAISAANGVIYHQGRPFSGTLTEAHENGQLKSQTEYFSGRKHGKSEEWYADGQRHSIRYYKAGKKEGRHFGWWPNGQLKFGYFFVNGEHHGELREWHENGQLAALFHYQNGKEAGEQKAWRENGKLYINLVVKNGKRYGLFKPQPCFTVKDDEGNHDAGN
jgi:hypothetical protein